MEKKEKDIQNILALQQQILLENNLSFEDLQLSKDQQTQFDDLSRSLKIAKDHYKDLLKSFGSKKNQGAMLLIGDPDLAKKSFSDIENAFESSLKKLETRGETIKQLF